MPSLATFRRKRLGTTVGSGQCVALAREWMDLCYGGNTISDGVMPIVAAAKDFWTRAPDEFWRKDNSGAPPVGALVIFKPTSGNRYGHVAIARAGNTATSDLSTFDQNFSRPNFCTDETHIREAAYGWLILKETDVPQFTEEEAKQIKNLLAGFKKRDLPPGEAAGRLVELDKRLVKVEKSGTASPHTHKVTFS